jgi:hypothetical protein
VSTSSSLHLSGFFLVFVGGLAPGFLHFGFWLCAWLAARVIQVIKSLTSLDCVKACCLSSGLELQVKLPNAKHRELTALLPLITLLDFKCALFIILEVLKPAHLLCCLLSSRRPALVFQGM